MPPLRRLRIETPNTILRVGIKWDALERDNLDEFHSLGSAGEAKRKLAAASSAAGMSGFILKLLRASFFLRNFGTNLETQRVQNLETKKAMQTYIEQDELESFDLDLCCFCYDERGSLVDYVTPASAGLEKVTLTEPAFTHSGDDTTGTGDAFDEMVKVEMRYIDPIQHDIFFVTVSINHGFNEVPGGSWAIMNSRHENVLLTQPMKCAEPRKIHVMARLTRTGTTWLLQEVLDYLPLDENEKIPLHQRVDNALIARYLSGNRSSDNR